MSCCSTTPDVHIGDYGTSFRVTLKDGYDIVDISTATTMELIFKPPNCPSRTQTAQFVTDGTDGQMEYVTVAGDIDKLGTWQLQAHIITSSGEWRSNVGTFEVVANL